jgi:hypothetical protein
MAWRGVTNRVDAAVAVAQAPGLNALRDRTPSEARSYQLARGDEPVLPGRNHGDAIVDGNGAFVRHTRTKAPPGAIFAPYLVRPWLSAATAPRPR